MMKHISAPKRYHIALLLIGVTLLTAAWLHTTYLGWLMLTAALASLVASSHLHQLFRHAGSRSNTSQHEHQQLIHTIDECAFQNSLQALQIAVHNATSIPQEAISPLGTQQTHVQLQLNLDHLTTTPSGLVMLKNEELQLLRQKLQQQNQRFS